MLANGPSAPLAILMMLSSGASAAPVDSDDAVPVEDDAATDEGPDPYRPLRCRRGGLCSADDRPQHR